MSEASQTSTDFEALMGKAAADIKAPPLLPPGIYRLAVSSAEPYALGEQNNEKKTPIAEFTFDVVAPYKVEDEAKLDGIDFGKKKLKDKFWLTEDAMSRLSVDFMQKVLGMDFQEGVPLRDYMQETRGQEFYALVVQNEAQRSGRTFNNIENYYSVASIEATEV